MELNGFWQVFAVGCFGGFLGELLKWYRLRENPRLPVYARSLFYWILTIIMIISGGFLACFYGITAVNGVLAVNVGISAPLIISALAATVPPASRQSGYKSQKPSLCEFLSGY
ncbi:MAG: hypothetical protein H6Q04_1032 [Acidobacteria bacterium]|nr:hypothetical protein [Acidobacteriota bacterium]